MWRSDAPLSTAIFSRSLTCIAYVPSGTGGGGVPRPAGPVPVGLSALRASGSSGLAGVHGLQPAVGIRRLSLDDLEESLLDRLGNRATPAAPHLYSVN